MEICFITPSNVGGHPECFMTVRYCPMCGGANEDTFLMPNCEYRCDCCGRSYIYKIPYSKPKPHKRMITTYRITWNNF